MARVELRRRRRFEARASAFEVRLEVGRVLRIRERRRARDDVRAHELGEGVVEADDAEAPAALLEARDLERLLFADEVPQGDDAREHLDRRDDALDLCRRGIDCMVSAVDARLLDEPSLALAYDNLSKMYAEQGEEERSRTYAEMASRAEASGKRR